MNTNIMVLGPRIAMVSSTSNRLQNHVGTCSTPDSTPGSNPRP